MARSVLDEHEHEHEHGTTHRDTGHSHGGRAIRGKPHRIDWDYAAAGRIGERDPVTPAAAALVPLLRPDTAQAMHRAGFRREALALLLGSPKFQRC